MKDYIRVFEPSKDKVRKAAKCTCGCNLFVKQGKQIKCDACGLECKERTNET